jgi:hypothetical protein
MDQISETIVDADGQLIFVFHPATNLRPMALDGIRTIFQPQTIEGMKHPENALYFSSNEIPRLK